MSLAEVDPGFELIADVTPDRWAAPRGLPMAYPANPRLGVMVRGFLVLIALAFATIFGIALWLNPYDEDGNPKSMATHTQLGLPPCNMVQLIGKPCPACGMTTSFALLVRGDVAAALRANAVGALTAVVLLAFVPWSLHGALRGRTIFVRSLERTLTYLVLGFLGLAMLRWLAVLGLQYLGMAAVF